MWVFGNSYVRAPGSQFVSFYWLGWNSALPEKEVLSVIMDWWLFASEIMLFQYSILEGLL